MRWDTYSLGRFLVRIWIQIFPLHHFVDVSLKMGTEALILISTNPVYEARFFIESPVQYLKIPISEHVVYVNCSEYQNKKHFVCSTCSELGIFMYSTGNSMNTLLSYCGLFEAKIRAPDNYLLVISYKAKKNWLGLVFYSFYLQFKWKIVSSIIQEQYGLCPAFCISFFNFIKLFI